MKCEMRNGVRLALLHYGPRLDTLPAWPENLACTAQGLAKADRLTRTIRAQCIKARGNKRLEHRPDIWQQPVPVINEYDALQNGRRPYMG